MLGKKRISIFTVILLGMIGVTFLSVAVVGSLWISTVLSVYSFQSRRLSELYLAGVESQLRTEVDRAIQYIDIRQSLVDEQMRRSLRERTDEAVAVADNLVRTHAGTMGPAALRKLVHDALWPMRFNKGRGYVFAADMNGVNRINGDHPEQEGTSLLDAVDTEGRHVLRDMIAIARDRGEGYYEYTWSKPGEPGQNFHKISYIRWFQPFDWLIGVGEYREDVQKDLQAEVVNRLEQIRFGRDGYVFAGREDGVSLTAPARGRPMIDQTDANGVKIVQELIHRAKAGGGFVRYVMPPIGGKRSSPKLSYARWLPSWRWYVGAGVYIDEIDSALTAQAQDLRARLARQIITTLAVLAGLLIIAVLAARSIAVATRRNFRAFTRFFEAAAAGNGDIPEGELRFREFARLAEYARGMLAERGRAEEEKDRLEGQLRQSQKMEAVGQLAGGVAHDFNNLLTVINGYTEMTLSDEGLSEALRQNLEEIRRAAGGASSLTRQLLAFSRQQVMEMRLVNLNDLVGGVEDMLRRLLGETITLQIRRAADLGLVRTDPGQIQAAIVNLALNARDAMPNGGALTIETANGSGGCHEDGQPAHTARSCISLTVRDTGVGMSPEVQARIFEPFFTTKKQGSGLGLAMVYGIIKQSNGQVTVASAIGKGSAFTLWFPRSPGTAPGHPTNSPGAADSTRSAGATTRGASETARGILLVEDEPEVQNLLGRVLRSRGYRVFCASNGREGLAVMKALEDSIDLVVSDVVMPVMSGPQMASELRRINPRVKVLFISGYAADGSTARALADGAQLMRKPFAMEDFAERVRAILEETPPGGTDASPPPTGDPGRRPG